MTTTLLDAQRRGRVIVPSHLQPVQKTARSLEKVGGPVRRYHNSVNYHREPLQHLTMFGDSSTRQHERQVRSCSGIVHTTPSIRRTTQVLLSSSEFTEAQSKLERWRNSFAFFPRPTISLEPSSEAGSVQLGCNRY
jgi:hypothetical protein